MTDAASLDMYLCIAHSHLQKSQNVKKTPLVEKVLILKKANTVALLSVKQHTLPSFSTTRMSLVKTNNLTPMVKVVDEEGLEIGSKVDLGGWTVVNRRAKHTATSASLKILGSLQVRPYLDLSLPTSSAKEASGADITDSVDSLEVIKRNIHIPIHSTKHSLVVDAPLTSSMVHEEEEV